MTNEELLDKLHDEHTSCIYGYMYGKPWIEVWRDGKTDIEPDRIICIDKHGLMPWRKDGETVGILYIWGYPGLIIMCIFSLTTE